jgi:hypothetical protein
MDWKGSLVPIDQVGRLTNQIERLMESLTSSDRIRSIKQAFSLHGVLDFSGNSTQQQLFRAHVIVKSPQDFWYADPTS